MVQSKILKYIIGVCVIAVAVFLVLSLMGFVDRSSIPKEEQISKEMEKLLEEKTEEYKDETASWKTYRNEIYGFEIDYPVVGWNFKECYPESPTVFILCKQQNKGEEKEICIYGKIELMYPRYYSLSWNEIMENAHNCFVNRIKIMYFEEEITTNSGVKGYKGKAVVWPEEARGVLFPIPEKLVEHLHPVMFINYYLTWKHKQLKYIPEEIKTFNKVICSFRFIERPLPQ